MARFFVVSLFLLLMSFPAHADTSESKVFHTIDKTSCAKCQSLIDSYNNAVKKLQSAKAELRSLEDDMWDDDWDAGNLKNQIERGMGKTEGLTPHFEEGIAFLTETKAHSDDMKKNELPRLKQMITNLEYSLTDLKNQIKICEEQCKTSKTDKTLGALGVPQDSNIQLPFDWKGPYAEVCEECAKLALRLNSLPAAALKNLAELDAAESERVLAEIDIKKRKYFSIYYQHDDKGKAYALKRLEESEKKLKEIEDRVKRLQNDYHEFKKNFKQTLAEYNKCIKNCKGSEKPKKTACTFPDSRPAISIGSNSEVGSGAALTDKVESQAKGMAMGALNSVLGGSGVSVGGGGGDKEPKMDKDPTSGSFTNVSVGGADLGIRAGFTNEGLVVSTEIDDAPGDGTFHAQWLEDGQGTIYLPKRYLLIDIYRDWKLSVWWDYKRWRDGNLVEHRTGDSMTIGTDYIGTIALFEGAKGVANAIWHSLGFGTAVKGAKHIGAVYDVPPAALTGPCPLAVVTHISEPKNDPVTTIPVVGSLFAQGGSQANDNELVIRVTPGIVEFAD